MVVDDEKTPRLFETEAKTTTDIVDLPTGEEDSVSSDGDDALKLAGTHAHRFDEQYYARIRRKIVSHLYTQHS